MPVPVGHEQLSRVFFFFSLETSLVLEHQQKIKSPHRLHLNVKKKVGLASHRYHGRKKVNRYERLKNLQTASHLWVSMHMQFGFGLFCIYHFHFPEEFRQLLVFYCVGASRFAIS